MCYAMSNSDKEHYVRHLCEKPLSLCRCLLHLFFHRAPAPVKTCALGVSLELAMSSILHAGNIIEWPRPRLAAAVTPVATCIVYGLACTLLSSSYPRRSLELATSSGHLLSAAIAIDTVTVLPRRLLMLAIKNRLTPHCFREVLYAHPPTIAIISTPCIWLNTMHQ